MRDMGRLGAAALVMLALAGCSDDGDAAAAGGDDAATGEEDAGGAQVPDDAGGAAPPAVDAGPRPYTGPGDAGPREPNQAGCEHPFPPGETLQNLNPNDPRQTYAYTLQVPERYDGSPTPLVLNLHGFINDGPQQAAITRMGQVAEAEGFIVAYPNGFGSLRAWNAGDCCAFAEPERDDVGFLDDVIEHVAGNVCIDRTRIYATGFSNGGFMAYRLACERPHTFAALGSVSGVLGIDPATCTPDRITPLMHLHGTADLVVPYAGGSPTGFSLLFAASEPPVFRSVAATEEAWAGIAGCEAEPTIDLEMGDVRCELRSSCDDGASYRVCSFEGGGHSWPGGDTQALVDAFGTFSLLLGATPTSMDASQAMWDFFSQYSL